jgi:NADPH:quinone reductase-like Zn-dependent oxidoreductase
VQVARIHEHGTPDVIRVEDAPAPKPGAGEVLCRVLGVSLNHLDLWVRRGMPGVTVPFPRVLGCDATGEVVSCGPGAERFAPGARVVLEPGVSSGTSDHDRAGNDHRSDDYGVRGETCDGFAAEYVVIEERLLTPLPEGLDPVQAAAVPLVFLTAWEMLVGKARLQAGETVAVLGAASGVGSAAIQIARDLGARVIATGGSEAKRALGADLGAHEVVDHHDSDWPRVVKAANGGRGVDVVFEHVGPATWRGSMSCLAKNGRLVTCGGTTGPKVEVLLPHLFFKQLSVLGSTMGPRGALAEIFAKVASGAYRPVVHEVMPLSEIVRAHMLLEEGGVVGKLVLVPGS